MKSKFELPQCSETLHLRVSKLEGFDIRVDLWSDILLHSVIHIVDFEKMFRLSQFNQIKKRINLLFELSCRLHSFYSFQTFSDIFWTSERKIIPDDYPLSTKLCLLLGLRVCVSKLFTQYSQMLK